MSNWYRGRSTFVSLGVQYLVNALVYSTYVARLPDLRENTGLSLAQLGTVITVGNVAALVALPVSSRLIGWVGSRWVMVPSSLVYVGTLPVLSLTSRATTLVAAVVVMMVSNTLVDVALAKQSAVFSSKRERPVMNRLAGVYSVGALVGAGLAAVVAHAGVGATTHLVAISLCLAVAIVAVVPGLLEDDQTLPIDASESVVSWGSHAAMLLVMLVASAATVPLDIGPGEWATFRAREDLGLEAGAVTGAYAAFIAGTCVGRFGGDHVAGILGRLRTLRWSVGCSMAGLAVACFVPHVVAVYLGFAIAGVGSAVQAPLLTEAAGRGPNAALTAFFIGNRLAGLATPVTIGVLAGLSFMNVGIAIAAVAFPCVIVLAMLGRRSLESRW